MATTLSTLICKSSTLPVNLSSLMSESGPCPSDVGGARSNTSVSPLIWFSSMDTWISIFFRFETGTSADIGDHVDVPAGA